MRIFQNDLFWKEFNEAFEKFQTVWYGMGRKIKYDFSAQFVEQLQKGSNMVRFRVKHVECFSDV